MEGRFGRQMRKKRQKALFSEFCNLEGGPCWIDSVSPRPAGNACALSSRFARLEPVVLILHCFTTVSTVKVVGRAGFEPATN